MTTTKQSTSSIEIAGTKFYPVTCQKWKVMDSWSGPEDGGYSFHVTPENCTQFISEYWSYMPDRSHVPETYHCSDGNPFTCKVDEEMYKLLTESKNGLMVYGTFFSRKDIFIACPGIYELGCSTAFEIAKPIEGYEKTAKEHKRFGSLVMRVRDKVIKNSKDGSEEGMITEFLDDSRAVVSFLSGNKPRYEVMSLHALVVPAAEERAEKLDLREKLLKTFERRDAKKEIKKILDKATSRGALSEKETQKVLKQL